MYGGLGSGPVGGEDVLLSRRERQEKVEEKRIEGNIPSQHPQDP